MLDVIDVNHSDGKVTFLRLCGIAEGHLNCFLNPNTF